MLLILKGYFLETFTAKVEKFFAWLASVVFCGLA